MKELKWQRKTKATKCALAPHQITKYHATQLDGSNKLAISQQLSKAICAEQSNKQQSRSQQ
jgi:hypothetical protein